MNIDIHQHPGRRPYQEDRFLVTHIHDGVLLAVLDGHGGPAVAEDAAMMLPGLVQRFLQARAEITPAEALAEAIGVIVEETADGRPEAGHRRASGATLSVAYVAPAQITTAVLGDSPILLRIDGEDWMSPAHNVELNPEDVARIEAAHQARIMRGELRITSAHLLLGSFAALALTRALGDPEFEAYLIREPQIMTHPLTPDSAFTLILASDGIQVSADAELLQRHYTDLLDQVQAGRSAGGLGRQHANDPRASDNLTILTVNHTREGETLTLRLREHEGMNYLRESDIPPHLQESLDDALRGSTIPAVPGVADAVYPQDVLSWADHNDIKIELLRE